MLERLLGNEPLKADLGAALAAHRLPHSILLCGMAGLGKNFAARCIAADYLYPTGGDGAERVMAGACEECITLQSEGAGNIIRVERVREMRSVIGETALMAEGRVVLVREAQRLHPGAAAALLKVIEEPPEGVVFLLTADSEASILPTIRSRCAVYTMAPVPEQTCAAALAQAGCAAQDAALLCAVYGGALGSCLAGAEKDRLVQLHSALRAMNAAAAKDAYALLCMTAPLTAKKERDVIAAFLQDAADLLGAALSGAAVPGLLVAVADAARLLPAVQTAREDLLANANQKLLVTLLVARLAGQLA